jgi:hypothetical protein
MKRVQSHTKEGNSAPLTDSASVRKPWPRPLLMPFSGSDEAPRYRLVWRHGQRRLQRDRTWGHLSRRASAVREAATRDGRVTADSCGAASLVVEVGGQRTYLWRNWQGRGYPFVCALLEELGRANPFKPSAPSAETHASSANDSRRAERVTRRDRSARS